MSLLFTPPFQATLPCPYPFPRHWGFEGLKFNSHSLDMIMAKLEMKNWPKFQKVFDSKIDWIVTLHYSKITYIYIKANSMGYNLCN